jgi:hypothetical protein
MLLTLVHFWWWEYRLTGLQHWTFEVYLFLITYSTLLFLLCTLLFPDQIADYSGYEEFFISRRMWFFGIFAATILFDVADTLIKGPARYPLLPRSICSGCRFISCCVQSRSGHRTGAFTSCS